MLHPTTHWDCFHHMQLLPQSNIAKWLQRKQYNPHPGNRWCQTACFIYVGILKDVHLIRVQDCIFFIQFRKCKFIFRPYCICCSDHFFLLYFYWLPAHKKIKHYRFWSNPLKSADCTNYQAAKQQLDVIIWVGNYITNTTSEFQGYFLLLKGMLVS